MIVEDLPAISPWYALAPPPPVSKLDRQHTESPIKVRQLAAEKRRKPLMKSKMKMRRE
jgi:hypothetical protein